MDQAVGALKRRPVGVEAEPTPYRAGAEGHAGGRRGDSGPCGIGMRRRGCNFREGARIFRAAGVVTGRQPTSTPVIQDVDPVGDSHPGGRQVPKRGVIARSVRLCRGALSNRTTRIGCPGGDRRFEPMNLTPVADRHPRVKASIGRAEGPRLAASRSKTSSEPSPSAGMSKIASSDEGDGELIVFCVPDQGLCVCSPGHATTPVAFRRLAEDAGSRWMRAVGQKPEQRPGADAAIVPSQSSALSACWLCLFKRFQAF